MPHALHEFAEFLKPNERLAPYMFQKLGGPAEFLPQPRTRDQLAALVRRCFQEKIPLRVLGGGCNVLVRDEGVKGVVLWLSEPAFTEIRVNGNIAHAGTGAAVTDVISQAAGHSLAGLETLIGIPGTVGGALRCNAGDRVGDISQFVRLVEVLDPDGQVQVRERDELRFGYQHSNLDDPVILTAEFRLEKDDPDAIVKRLRRAWIQRKASEAPSILPSFRVFRNPRALNAAALLEQAGLARMRVGGAEVSERDPNCVIIHPEATSRDVLRLVEVMRSRVQERFAVDLELQLAVW
jgi:UDP-N-acetylmuramate dehydrogenase